MLTRRELPSQDSMHRAMDAAGGLYVVPASADPQEVRTEVFASGIRALELLAGADVEMLRGLPVEFLIVGDASSVEPLGSLEQLRGLHVGSWTGQLGFQAWPRLEWFGTTEIARGQLEPLLAQGHDYLHHLAVGRYRFVDVAPLRGLTQLTHLAVGDSRAFTSLDGLADVRHLRHLSVYICPKLESLTGVEAALHLQHLEIDRCNRITNLLPLASARNLRSLRIEMKEPPTLTPLTNHPALEYIWVVSATRPAPDLVGDLLESPRLRFVAAGRSCWLRDDGQWQHVPNIYDMTARQRALHDQLVNEWHSVAVW